MSEPYVLGIGAANIDVHGKSRAPPEQINFELKCPT